MAQPLPTADEVFGAAPAESDSQLHTDSVPGLVTPGNIDLNNRPVVKNPDGSISTVRSITVGLDGGKAVVLPTVSKEGKNLQSFALKDPYQPAIDHFKATGEHLGVFDSEDHATAYAQQLHQDQAAQYGPKAAAPLPSADEAFGPSGGSNFLTRLDGQMQSSLFRIFNAFGTGAKAGFGDEPITTPTTALSPETEGAMKKLGLFNDYAKGQDGFLRGMFEGITRNSVAGLALAQRGANAALSAPLQGAGQALEETGLAAPGGATGTEGLAGATTDPGVMMALAPLGVMGELHNLSEFRKAKALANVLDTLSEARASAVIGEGEAAFHDIVPPTADQAAARMDAANEAGVALHIEPPAVPPDVHTVARQVDPEAFKAYDALAAEKDTHRATITGLAAEREALPEAAAAQEEIQTILGKVNGVEERLTKKAASRLADAQGRLDAALTLDTPEMAAARQKLMEADVGMRDLAPDVSAAYAQARSLMPETPDHAPGVAAAYRQAEEQMGGAPTELTYKSTEAPAPVAPEFRTNPAAIATEHAAEVSRLEAEAAQAAGAGAKPAAELTPAEAADKAAAISTQPHQKTVSGGLPAVKGTGELKTRSLAEGVEAKAIEERLTGTFGDLPEYHSVSMADQAAKARSLIERDYEDAKAMALGQKAPPKGVLPESVFVAVERRALADGDVETLRQLATQSKLTTAATTMGQRIRTLRERDAASPVGAIQEVQKAREAALTNRGELETARKAVVDEMKAAMRRTAASQPAWEDFVKSITCAE